MEKTSRRSWTDDDIGYLTDNWDRPIAEQAESLGRSFQSVVKVRRKIKDGWVGPQRIPWTEDENEVLRTYVHYTPEQLRKLLPTRTVWAITRQRTLLGAAVRGSKSPAQPGQRPILAKTCLICGLLLAKSWFPPATNGMTLSSYCKKCHSNKRAEWQASLSPERQAEASRKASERASAYNRMAQALTVPLAENNNQEYTEADHVVLSDPSRTNLDKALTLKRSYLGVLQAVVNNGYTSRIRMADPLREQWFINNPNVEKLDEIIQLVKETVPPARLRPDFEWED